MKWFPRPATPEDVELLGPSPDWTHQRVFDLLSDPSGTELYEKVGVAGARDGSAKSTTRLISVRGWILKTDIESASPSHELVRERVAAARARGEGKGIWHPNKRWALLRSAEKWHHLTLCPELRTLRQLERWDDRALAWVRMIRASLDVSRQHGLGLDLNPSNFGLEETALYYLDDDLYEELSELNLAGAIIGRIPEEPAAGVAEWQRFGAALERAIRDSKPSLERLRYELSVYPLPERFEPARAAILSAFSEALPKAPSRTAPDLTCVLADVHGNLAALESVLADARAQGANNFLFLGDAVGYGPQPAECVRLLAELPRAVLVRGNHDHAVATGRFELGMNAQAREAAEWTRSSLGAAELAWLASLPIEHIEGDWRAVHGAPKDPNRFLAYVYELTYEENLRYLRDHRIPVCFYGHTHVQLTHAETSAGPLKLPGERTVQLDPRRQFLVNPGSVGQPRDGDPRAAYALWRRDTGEVRTRRVEYDFERTLRALRGTPLPTQLVTRLQTGT